ncbi:hypothetical protein [Spirillospora albida]|uniref:hypothetical protein n=1 Tax=Spirillospora albida TaxID=58123 RepID=UPI0012F85187|nr:hypothetical protein [Spirillospora albida]
MSYVAPWAAATALAVTLSWLGVRGVVRGAVSERSAPPLAGPVIHGSPSSPADIGSPTTRASAPAGEDSAPRPKPAPKPSPGPSTSPSRPTGDVRSYGTRGGHAVLAVSGGRVRLVSATPKPGYETRVTQADRWLRVDFLDDDHTSSIVANWERDPKIDVYEY